MNAVKIGDVIKALDFPGRADCYMVGKVIEVSDEMIRCAGISRVWAGVAEAGQDFQTVAQGEHFMDEAFPGRVTVIA